MTSLSHDESHQQDQDGLIKFQKKDKFYKFYDRESDDYVFKIENLPDAFEKMEDLELESGVKEKERN